MGERNQKSGRDNSHSPKGNNIIAWPDLSAYGGIKERLKVQPDGRPRLFVCESCPETISEFYDYAWQPQADGRNAKEVPLKDRDHAMDPLRYMVMKLDQCRGGGLAIPGFLPTK